MFLGLHTTFYVCISLASGFSLFTYVLVVLTGFVVVLIVVFPRFVFWVVVFLGWSGYFFVVIVLGVLLLYDCTPFVFECM